jgi:SsrA-binding protein
VLRGTEVKACREGHAQIHEAWVQVQNGEAFLVGSHIAEYRQGNRFNHLPERSRKLLLHKKELDKLEVETHQQGQVAIPLSLYFKDGRVKLELGVGTGKTHQDRREDIKERESRREMERAVRRRR